MFSPQEGQRSALEGSIPVKKNKPYNNQIHSKINERGAVLQLLSSFYAMGDQVEASHCLLLRCLSMRHRMSKVAESAK